VINKSVNCPWLPVTMSKRDAKSFHRSDAAQNMLDTPADE
jgi:hypothetical protein